MDVKLLHIMRSEPDEVTKRLVKGVSQGETTEEVALHRGTVDYAKLVQSIFANDKVICWW